MESRKAEVKQQYNEIMKRWKKYEAFVSDKDVSMGEKIKWSGQAQKLTNELSEMLKLLKNEGIAYTDYEILNGFEIKLEVPE